MKLFTIILFAITYILMIALPKYRPWIALTTAGLFVVTGVLPLPELGPNDVRGAPRRAPPPAAPPKSTSSASAFINSFCRLDIRKSINLSP